MERYLRQQAGKGPAVKAQIPARRVTFDGSLSLMLQDGYIQEDSSIKSDTRQLVLMRKEMRTRDAKDPSLFFCPGTTLRVQRVCFRIS